MRALAAIVLVVGCSTDLGHAPRLDAGADASVAEDAAIAVDSGARDAMAPGDSGLADIGPPDVGSDTGPACTPTRTTCNVALECGAIPNGCPGGVIPCVACSGGETWCATLAAPRWRSRVMSCVTSVTSAHPEYFDTTHACSTGFTFVLDARAAEYVRDVAACVNGSGALAIVDPNAPTNEIRVRGTDDDVADNYGVRLYGSGCSSGRYTSSCTPSGF
jgi:hypothetical protein